jgi:hypothetical protein
LEGIGEKMKKELIRIKDELHHAIDGKIIDGKNNNMIGDCTGLRGDCTELRGNCTGLSGDCTGLSGDCTGLSGDLNDCDISKEERKKGINIKDLTK